MKNKWMSVCMLLALISCEKNVHVKIPAREKKLVMNGIVRNTAVFRISVGQSAGILDQTTPESYNVKNAFVQLYDNSVARDTLLYDSAGNVYRSRRNITAIQGHNYKVVVAAQGFTSIEAETTSPVATIIQSVNRSVNVKKDASGNWLDEVKIVFNDNVATTNYYLFKFRRPIYVYNASAEYNGLYCMHSADIDIERGNNNDPVDFDKCIDEQFFMSDANFNGSAKELLLFISHDDLLPIVNPANNRTYKPYFELQSITKDHYRYLKSFNSYNDANGNPFAEPVLVYTNVKNGYGIFATYDLSRDTIR